MLWSEEMRTRNRYVRVLSVAFLAILLLFGTTAHLSHVHADGSAHADCALCQTAHGAVQPATPPSIQHVSLVSTRVTPLFTPVYREHVFSFSHWNRPPPDQT